MHELPPELFQRWYHSHEEDTADEEVFRPADFPFPPARAARRSLEFQPDGTYVEYRAGPADRAEGTPGRWEAISADTLRVSEGQRPRTLKIEALDKTTLKFRK